MHRITSLFGVIIPFLLGFCISPPLWSDEDDTNLDVADDTAVQIDVSFYHDVWPILRDRCQGCHQPAKAGGKLVLSSYETLIAAADDDDKVVVPGKPDASLLIEAITPDGDGPPSMPKKAAPLSQVEIDLFRRWISEGAEDDTPDAAKRPVITMEKPPVYENLPVLTSVDYSPDGKWLAVSGYHEVLLHKADGSERVGRLVGLAERIESLEFSPDGKLLAVTGGSPAQGGEVQIWDVEKQKLRVSVPVTYDTIYGVCWSHDGARVSFGCADNSVRVIDAKSGEQVLFQGAHGDWVLGTAFSKDSSHLVSVGRDRSMKLIKVDTQQFIDNITSITPGALVGGLMAVDRHPQKDELLTGGADGTPKIYRMFREKARKIGDDYNLIRAFERMPGRVFSCEFNADGTRIVAGSSYNSEGETRVYNVADGKLLWKHTGSGAIYDVAFSPDGQRVAICGYSGELVVLDGDKGTIVKKFVPVPYQPREVVRERAF